MKGTKKSGIFGGAFLLSDRAAADRAAADRAAAERAAVTVWRLSPRERKIAEALGKAQTPAGTNFDPFDLDYLLQQN